MSVLNLKGSRLSDRDLDFLVDTVSPEVTDKPRLKKVIKEDKAEIPTSVAKRYSGD